MTPDTALLLEQRPREFSARFVRGRVRTVAMRARRRHRGRRAAVLLAAIAVPALASPGNWHRFDIGDAGRAEVTVEPMPFERAGDSFPGSAFYYLANDDEYYLPPPGAPLVRGIRSDAQAGPGVDFAGPAARPLRVDNSGVDRTRALQCLTAAIYYEAASEPDPGQRAVAQVVLNRVAHPAYPSTVCGVVYQGSERSTGCQFSFTCDGSLARAPNRLFWLRAENVARAALAGYVYLPVGLATHYHTIAVHPYWAPSLSHVGTIGAHRFYRFAGAAGQPGAFRFTYGGGEPLAAPHARRADAMATDVPLDPLAIQRAFGGSATGMAEGAGTSAAMGRDSATPAMHRSTPPPPAYAPDLSRRGGDTLYRGEKLPEAGAIRPEYRHSGQWISQPGT